MGKMLTLKQAAERLHVRPRSLRKWMDRWPGAELRQESRGPVWYIPEDTLGWWYEQDHTPGRKLQKEQAR